MLADVERQRRSGQVPVEVFAAFIAEQALQMALGGAAFVMVAPALVSNVGTPGQVAASNSIAITENAQPIVSSALTVNVSGIAVVPTFPAAASLVTKPGHIIYMKAAGGAHWYRGKVTSLIADAQAARTSQYADTMTLAGILASLPKARVVSDIPGRARLRVKYLRGRASQARYTADALVTAPGINRVKASSYTGSLLIYYDTRQYSSLDALLEWIATE